MDKMKVIAPASDPDSNVNNIHYMRNNIPFSMVMVMAMLNQYSFTDMNCTPANKAIVISTFLLLTVIDVVWTVYHCKIDFTVNYPHTGHKWIKYAVIRSATSVLAFYSVNYFIHLGAPFNCFFPYNAVMANVMFYLCFLTVSTVSFIEHYYWKKLSIPLLAELHE